MNYKTLLAVSTLLISLGYSAVAQAENFPFRGACNPGSSRCENATYGASNPHLSKKVTTPKKPMKVPAKAFVPPAGISAPTTYGGSGRR